MAGLAQVKLFQVNFQKSALLLLRNHCYAKVLNYTRSPVPVEVRRGGGCIIPYVGNFLFKMSTESTSAMTLFAYVSEHVQTTAYNVDYRRAK